IPLNGETMSAPLLPTSPAELVDAIRSAPRVIAVGAGTKPRMSAVSADYVRVSTTQLRGIVEYEPSEFTFTALAGTPLQELAVVLAERGQYLPFDPLFAAAGATLGGTVAAGLSGPGRFRFGGLRDFILGVRFVDGEGRLLRMGGKVVKNAAGFDLPKFFVGSVGRFGVLAELTFKVFPRPVTQRTLRLEVRDLSAKLNLLSEAGRARWELDALEGPLEESVIYARLAGPAAALELIAAEILQRWSGATLDVNVAADLWQAVSDFSWSHPSGTLVKVVIAPSDVAEFATGVRSISDARGWIGAGGNVGFVSLPPGTAFATLRWPAVTLRGDAALWPGAKPRFELMRAVKSALDPNNRFPDLDE
ncbi:MAG TPA: FAD-binding protein, partial [Opitutus sp.]|nr:FAD-binding protein [Opitutus sp.]